MPFKPEPPKISWRGTVPLSTQFDDLYYSDSDGEAESIFVFLDSAQVIKNAEKKTNFVIGETGFGTGLNFLTTWRAWQKKKTKSRLTFISAEAFPMQAADMEKAHQAFPSLQPFSKQLLSVWPPAASGTHIRNFDNGNVSLMLLFGDAYEAFQQLHAKIDAWYLDGFAPAKNPAMWTDSLFKRMADLSNNEATLATFTAAGLVRRGLEAHGFEMTKHPGYGLKRERMVGIFRQGEDGKSKNQSVSGGQHEKPIEWAAIPKANTEKIAIVGDGVAGASVAYALAKRGLSPVLVAPSSDELKASKLPAAILAPQLMLEDTIEKSFFYAAFSYAVCHPAYINAFSPTRGTKYVPTTPLEGKKYKDILRSFNWNIDWLNGINNGLVLPKGGTIDPKKILGKLSHNIKRAHNTLAKLERCSNGWRLLDDKGSIIMEAPTVVIATGAHTANLLKTSGLAGDTNTNRHPTIRLRLGQLECVQADAISNVDDYTYTYGGYISSSLSNNDGGEMRTIGSTFEKISNLPQSPIKPSDQAQKANLETCKMHTDARIETTADITSWVGIRATTPDHMPYAGPIPDWVDVQKACSSMAIDRNLPLMRTPNMEAGLYCLAGLGSKGFQYGPLLGEYIAAIICDEPSPLPTALHAKLHPARGFIKDIIRGNETASQ